MVLARVNNGELTLTWTIKNEWVESAGFVSKNSRTKTRIWNVLIRDLFTRLKKTVTAQQCMVSWDCCVMAEGEGLSVEVVDKAVELWTFTTRFSSTNNPFRYFARVLTLSFNLVLDLVTDFISRRYMLGTGWKLQ